MLTSFYDMFLLYLSDNQMDAKNTIGTVSLILTKCKTFALTERSNIY